MASLIAAIRHCQTQPIELVYFATTSRIDIYSKNRTKKKSAGSDGNHLKNTDQNGHLLPAILVSHEDFFGALLDQEKQTRQQIRIPK